jgi:translation elongation factor EF-Ts
MISLVTYLRQRSMQAFNVDNNRYIQQLIGNFLSIHTQAVDIDSWRKRIESFCGVQLQEIFDAPTLDEVAQNFFAFHKLTIAAVAQELCDTVAEIKSYNDGELLNAYYARIANRVVEQVSETFGNQSISALLENKQTVFEYYCALPTAELKQQFIQRCLVFNVEVIDASALHRMYQTPKHKTFIFMGALHIANLQNIVEKLGYERIAAYGPDLYTSVQTWLHDPLKTYYSLDGSLFDKTANTTEFGWYQWGKSIYKKVTNYFQ